MNIFMSHPVLRIPNIVIQQVTIRQPKSGREVRHDLMVMENLTFGRNITRQYDLKGALYARFNSGSDGTGDVLLDQNFVNDMNSSPLYVSNKAKHFLQRAVWNDTTFLKVSNTSDRIAACIPQFYLFFAARILKLLL